MCTLLVWKHRHPRYPLIAAAGRDEFFDRPATSPQSLLREPLVIGGKDLTAGGTWFALSAGRIVVAVTNRRGAGRHDPSRRSRGALVLSLAASRSVRELIDRIHAIDPHAFNPFIIFAGDRDEAVAAHGGDDGLRVDAVADGAHAITNWDLDADRPPKAARAKEAARAFSLDPEAGEAALLTGIRALLADHGSSPGAADGTCVHRPEERYGTRSATVAFVGSEPSLTRLFHADGPPCTTPFVEVTDPLRHESTANA